LMFSKYGKCNAVATKFNIQAKFWLTWNCNRRY
jgi:hypothetical protein